MIDLSYGINMGRSFFRFIHTFDKQTDGWTTDGHLAHGYAAAA